MPVIFGRYQYFGRKKYVRLGDGQTMVAHINANKKYIRLDLHRC